jgi:transposase
MYNQNRSEMVPADQERKQLKELRATAEQLKSIIGFLSNEYSNFHSELLEEPVKGLWRYYFIIELHIMRIDPTDSRTQEERASKIQELQENYAVSAYGLKAITRWERTTRPFFD